MEKEHTCCILSRRLDRIGTELINAADEVDKKADTGNDYLLLDEFSLGMGRMFSEGTVVAIKLASSFKERKVENNDFCPRLSELTESEFNRIYASRMRDPDQQMRHEDGSGYSQSSSTTKHIERARDCTSDSPCS